ncbi:interleukin-3 [Fukomys damarensis]|uniref:interleukin-3 n=1 Tax=Fukomys damarensis TaxID=885580 RepID=UPI00053FB789|nr:interleukin-3 [Fukomys damarensis]
MYAATPGLSGFPTLLLSLLLFRPGLQAPIEQHRSVNLTDFNGTIREIQRGLGSAPAEPDPSLGRKNLCAFLKSMNSSDETFKMMRKNLEKNPVIIKNWDDFREKLNYYLENMLSNESKATGSTSTPLPWGIVPVYSPGDWNC